MGASLSYIVISNKYFEDIIQKKTCQKCKKLILEKNCYLYKEEIICKCNKINNEKYLNI